ncbi:GTPase Era [Weissella viridescens]|uniref:GTPase Era n=1 Tax=Weissella viridescens TaxID=1629 RepID=A0A380P802_WEIVI|nr:GTPase Era [Weissella viridescens]
MFIDTPGIHKPQNGLGDFMMKTANSALHEADMIWFVVNADEPRGGGDDYIINRLKDVETPVYLVINKVDLVQPQEVLPMIADYQAQMDFAEISQFQHGPVTMCKH